MALKRLDWKKTDPPHFDRVPERAGIYIISTVQDADNEYEVKYVGQANNLREHAKEHFSKKEQNKELKEHIDQKYMMKFNYSEVDSQSDRDGMELYMYELYAPPFNHNTPPGETVISCTVPAAVKKR